MLAGGPPLAQKGWGAPPSSSPLLSYMVLDHGCAEGCDSRRLPPTPRWVKDALGWGWPGESPELCGSRSGSLLSEGLRSPPPSSQPPLSQACSGKHLSLRFWLDPIWGQASQPWMCRPRGLSDLHGDLITRSHSWSLPKRFSAFRPQTANRQSSFPPRFVNNLRGPEGPSPYPGSTYPVSFCLLPHPTLCLWRNPLLLSCR